MLPVGSASTLRLNRPFDGNKIKGNTYADYFLIRVFPGFRFPGGHISTQVLQELCNIITRKFKFNYAQAIAAINECSSNNNLHTNTESTIVEACRLAERYGFSFFDGLIISAALEANRATLYSKDLQNGQTTFDTICNHLSVRIQYYGAKINCVVAAKSGDGGDRCGRRGAVEIRAL